MYTTGQNLNSIVTDLCLVEKWCDQEGHADDAHAIECQNQEEQEHVAVGK